MLSKIYIYFKPFFLVDVDVDQLIKHLLHKHEDLCLDL